MRLYHLAHLKRPKSATLVPTETTPPKSEPSPKLPGPSAFTTARVVSVADVNFIGPYGVIPWRSDESALPPGRWKRSICLPR